MIGKCLAATIALAVAATSAHAAECAVDIHAPSSASTAAFVVPGSDYPLVLGRSQLDPESGTPPHELLAAIAHWVAAAMNLPPPQTLPRIAFSTSHQLAVLRYGGNVAETVSGIDMSAPDQRQSPSVVALYDEPRRTIQLSEGWTGSTAAELSVLVHEMVHHIQAGAGQRFACPAAREKDAFAVQAQWLALFGSSLEAAYEIDDLSLLVRTICGI